MKTMRIINNDNNSEATRITSTIQTITKASHNLTASSPYRSVGSG